MLEESAITLPKAFDDEAFELRKVLTGVEKQEDRYKRCIDATTGALGELLGKQYADKYFPPTAKQTAITNFEAIIASLHDDLATLDWMSEATRQLARRQAREDRQDDRLSRQVAELRLRRSSATTSPAMRCARTRSRTIARTRSPASRGTAASGA